LESEFVRLVLGKVKDNPLGDVPFSAVFSLKYGGIPTDRRVEVEEDRSKLGLAFGSVEKCKKMQSSGALRASER
jgi:hypothetical protein